MSDATNDRSADHNRQANFRRSASADANQTGLPRTYLERFGVHAVLPANRDNSKAIESLDLEVVNRARARAGLAPLAAEDA